jgi:RNA polymerase sigma-70 factor (ECF subfamily)
VFGSDRTLPASAEGEREDDVALLRAVAGGDKRAFARFYRTHVATVLRFLARMRGVHRGSEDDLAHQVFLEVERHAGSYQGRSSVPGWLYGITVNVVRHHVRSEVRMRKRNEASAPPDDASVRSPEDRYADAERARAVRAAIERLPEDLRLPFCAVMVDELPGREVAEALGIPEGTLWRRLHDARKLLKASLGGEA